MKIQVKKDRLTQFPADAVVLTHFENLKTLENPAREIDGACRGLIQRVIDGEDFTGKLFQTIVLYPGDSILFKRIILVGLGKKEDFNVEKMRGAYAAAAKQAGMLNVCKISSSPDIDREKWPIGAVSQAMVEGFVLGLYQFKRFKSNDKEQDKNEKKFFIIDHRDNVVTEARASVNMAEIIVRAVCFARDMVTTPANEMTPLNMERRAREIAAGRNIKLKVLNTEEMQKLGMNALLGVARGSCEPAKFIILEYRGAKKSDPFIILVGKGLTFDSGGISIKPADKMDEMKSDMAGGAAVISAVKAASELNLKVNVVALVPATENMPGGRAYKPGDILTSLSGKTIEVVNTDAEGRLILADALAYSCRYKPAAIIDIATLTGACVIALGDHVIGMMGNNDPLKEKIKSASEETGERVWELPLWEDYHELIKSDVADLKNTGGRAGGAITAAAFLSNFVNDVPWVHLDIAGPAWLTKDRPYIPKGASGVGVRLLVHLLQNWHA